MTVATIPPAPAMSRTSDESVDASRLVFVRNHPTIGQGVFWRFKVADLPKLFDAGIIAEDGTTELLDGFFRYKDRADVGGDRMSIGRKHKKTVERLSDLRLSLNSDARHVECQQPLQCSDFSLPEPDFMIVRGTLDDDDDRYVNGADVLVVVEVSASSYEADVYEKLEKYARAGVAQYVILNLRNRTAEVYERPDVAAGTYALRTIVAETETLRLSLGDGATSDVPLASILA